MLSAVILTEGRYPAMQLVSQPVHESFVLLGPLVLEKGPFKILRPQRIGDRHSVTLQTTSSTTSALWWCDASHTLYVAIQFGLYLQLSYLLNVSRIVSEDSTIVIRSIFCVVRRLPESFI
jgi:hypothetical protein